MYREYERAEGRGEIHVQLLIESLTCCEGYAEGSGLVGVRDRSELSWAMAVSYSRRAPLKSFAKKALSPLVMCLAATIASAFSKPQLVSLVFTDSNDVGRGVLKGIQCTVF